MADCAAALAVAESKAEREDVMQLKSAVQQQQQKQLGKSQTAGKAAANAEGGQKERQQQGYTQECSQGALHIQRSSASDRQLVTARDLPAGVCS